MSYTNHKWYPDKVVLSGQMWNTSSKLSLVRNLTINMKFIVSFSLNSRTCIFIFTTLWPTVKCISCRCIWPKFSYQLFALSDKSPLIPLIIRSCCPQKVLHPIIKSSCKSSCIRLLKVLVHDQSLPTTSYVIASKVAAYKKGFLFMAIKNSCIRLLKVLVCDQSSPTISRVIAHYH